MGVIRDGRVTGFIASSEAFAVHYPGYPSSISGAVDKLGGAQGINKARSTNRLELHFRPEDPYSHPAVGELRPCNNLLLKISKNKNVPDIPPVCAAIVARVREAYHFDGMVDYQHVIPVHAHAPVAKKRNWLEMQHPHTQSNGLMGFDEEHVMILVPPLFSPKDVPENLVLRPSVMLSSKKNQDAVTQSDWEVDIEPVLGIDFKIDEIPKRINWEEYIPQGSDQWESQMAVSKLFDERPIWIKHSLNERLRDQGYNFVVHMLRRLLSRVSYYFSGGPFLRFWIKKGYDPRKDPNSRIYQRIDFRVHPSLRSVNNVNQAKQRWEDICTFRVFPFKCQTSLQLFELADDYIQQEIRKPPSQKSCTYGTGWFSFAVLDNLRQRITVRFLSIYPNSGVEHLLKAATESFEKSKRRLNKGNVMLHEEEHHEVDAEVLGSEDVEQPNNVEDEEDEDEEFEVENDEEGDDEISLRSHSYLNMESISRTHLQELFGSFPSTEGGDKIQNADTITSDEEYQIFEQDSDGNGNFSDEYDY